MFPFAGMKAHHVLLFPHTPDTSFDTDGDTVDPLVDIPELNDVPKFEQAQEHVDPPVQEHVDEPNPTLHVVDRELIPPVVHDMITVEKSSRHSSRTSNPLVWMKHHVTNVTNTEHPYCISDYLTNDSLSLKYQAYLSNISDEVKLRN